MIDEPTADRRLRRPFGVFICVAIGLIVGRWLAPPPEACAVVGLVLGVIACARVPSRVRVAILGIVVMSLGAAWWSVRIENAPSRVLLEAVERLNGRPLVAVEGTVATVPQRRDVARGVFAEFARPGVSTHFRLSGIRFEGDETQGLRGSLWVSVSGATDSVSAGDRIRLMGRLSPAGRRTNPGDPPYRLRALQSGTAGFLHVPTGELIERIDGEGSRVIAARSWLQRRATRWLEPARRSGDVASAMLLAVLTGERVEALAEADQAVRRIGVAHLFAISGLHLMLLVFLGGMCARVVRDPGRSEPWLIVGLIVLYLILTPARAPIVRAAAVTIAFVLGEAAGTRWRREALLAWAATLTVLWRPMELFSPGFQLSYTCVTALCLFQRPMVARLFGTKPLDDTRRHGGWLLNASKNSLAAAIVAWLVATPILAYHAGMVNPMGVLAVLVVAPVFSVVLGFGFLTAGVSMLWPWLGGVVAPLALTLSDVFLSGVLALEGLPFMSVYVPRMPWFVAVLLCAASVWWLWSKRSAGSLAFVGIGLAVMLGAWLVPAQRSQGLPREVALRVDMLDVGNGSMYLLRSGNGSMLWDAGAQSLDFGSRRAPASLRALGAWRIPQAVLTHANLDHYAALPDLSRAVGLERLLTTSSVLEEAKNDPDGAVAVLMRELERDGVRIEEIGAGHTLYIGDARVEVLWPHASTDLEEANNRSLVARVVVGAGEEERAVLMTGDIEKAAVRAIRSAYPTLRAQVLELPHHGSAALVGERFVEAVDPRVVFQSSGRSRMGDERWDDAKEGRIWLMSAEVGAAWAEILHDGTVRAGSMIPSQKR